MSPKQEHQNWSLVSSSRIDNVSASGCTVTWSEPEDDGGAAVQCYVVEKMVSNSGSWMACGRHDCSRNLAIVGAYGCDERYVMSLTDMY